MDSKMYYINIKDKGGFSKEVYSFPSLGVCVGHSHLAALFSLGKHTVIHASNQTLSGGTQCQARGEKRQAPQITKRLFVKPQGLFYSLSFSKTYAKLLPFKVGIT